MSKNIESKTYNDQYTTNIFSEARVLGNELLIKLINQPVERYLWNELNKSPDVNKLMAKSGTVLLLGSSVKRKNNLIELVRQNYPNSRFVVVDLNQDVINGLKSNYPNDELIQYILGDLSCKDTLREIKTTVGEANPLVIAKHLINFIDSTNLVRNIYNQFWSCHFFASVDYRLRKKPQNELKREKAALEHENIFFEEYELPFPENIKRLERIILKSELFHFYSGEKQSSLYG